MEPKLIVQNLELNTQTICSSIIKKQQQDDDDYECGQINELHGRRICACFHGWVILSNLPDSVLWSLWNPLTSKLIRLPPLKKREEEDSSYECCLSSPPIPNAYDQDQCSVLLLLSENTPTIVYCRLDCSKSRKRLKWTEMSYDKQMRSINVEDDCFLIRNPTCCNGKVYAITASRTYYRYLIQLDIVAKGKEEVVIRLLPILEAPCPPCLPCPSNSSSARYPILIGSCTDLFYIAVYTDEINGDVGLFKLDMTSMMWKEAADLQDAIIFLQFADECSAYYTRADHEGGGGYIHISDDNKIMYSFHVKDRTVSQSPMPFLPQQNCAMLQWRRSEVDHAESNKHEEEDKGTEIIVKGDATCGESHLLNMPLQILESIAEYCVGVEYLNFRATCKQCYMAAPLIQWSNKKEISRLQKYSLVSPWLMELDNCRDTISFTDPICGERYFMKKPQELKDGYGIYCSRFGWLLMFKIQGALRLVFFNPFTSSILELPELQYLGSFCFSAPPTSPDCMVVGFMPDGSHLYVHFVSGEPTWRRYRLNLAGDDPCCYRFPTFSGQDIYALRNNKSIEAFRDMTNDDFSWELVVDNVPQGSCKSPGSTFFLASCDQNLLLVIVGKFGESVEVFKLKLNGEEWEKMESLGKHMIYISDETSCICLEAQSVEMANKIYFPRSLQNQLGTKIVFYSLETHSYHIFDDDKNMQESFGVDFYGTKRHCNPHAWVEPSWS